MKTLTQDQYCPSLRAGWTLQDSIRKQVQIEDYINHMNDPIPEIPKMETRKVKWTYATWHAFRREISNLIRP